MSYSPTKDYQHSACYSHPPKHSSVASDIRTEGEATTKSAHQARLLPALARALHWYLQSLRSFEPLFPSTGTDSPFVSTHSGSPFASAGTGPPFDQAPNDTAGLYELGYPHAPLPLSSLPTGSSVSVPPFTAIPIPLGVGSPGQQHVSLPLPPHNGQLILDPPSFQC